MFINPNLSCLPLINQNRLSLSIIEKFFLLNRKRNVKCAAFLGLLPIYLGIIIKYSCHFSNGQLQFFFFLSNQNELPGFSPLSQMDPSSCSYLTSGTVSFIPMGLLISILMFRLENWEFSISIPLAPTFLVCVYSAF